MPSHGEIKWKESPLFSSKDDVRNALNIAANASNWSTIGGALLSFAGVVVMGVEYAVVGGSFTIAGAAKVLVDYYYEQYEEELAELLDKIEDLSAGESFTIMQKFTYHAGQRSWRPLNVFELG